MKIPRYRLVFALLLAAAVPSLAASVKVVQGGDARERVILENDLLRVQVDPNRGARVDSFQYKPWGSIEIIQDKNQQGLLVDHFWQEYWPGQFWEAKYDTHIVSQGPSEVAVKFSCLSRDKGVAQIAGIRLEKTITLKEHDPTLHASVRLTNPSSEGRYVGYWLQNVCWLGGDLKDDLYFRPGKRGISQDSSDDANPPDAGFVRDPQAGWMAAIDGRTKTGLVCFMDYNYLWFLYNCTAANTIEWQYDAVAIPPGKSWQTEVSFVPVLKLGLVSFASKQFLAGVVFREDRTKGHLEVAQTYLATDVPLASLEVQADMETLLSHQKQHGAEAQRLTHLGSDPQWITFALPYDTNKREPAVVRLTWKGTTSRGKAFTEETELWYGGSFVSNTNPTDGSPFYAIPSPRKEKTLIKPDKIARIVKAHPQVLFLKGLLSPSYKLVPAIQKLNAAVQVKEGYAYIGVFGPQLDHFPYDYDTLMGYDLVVVGDLSAACLGDAAMEMLKDYCEHGGNLLVLPGPSAYGNGGYKGTVIDSILPVQCQGPFDLGAAEGAVKSELPAGTIRAESLEALQPQYVHKVQVRQGGKVLLACGSAPLLVSGKCGGGKVYCLTAPPLGAHNYCDTPEWEAVLTYVLRDLGLQR